MRRHFFNEDYFKNIDTEDKAYWLGFIAADGCVIKCSSYNSYRLQISVSINDIEHLEKFLECIEANDIEIKTFKSSGFSSNNKKEDMAMVRLNSAKLCNDLRKYNIHERKSYDIEIPDLTNDMMIHYLRGFIDGDGSYHYHYDNKSNRYRYSFEIVGASSLMAYQLQGCFLSNGINVNVYTRKSKLSDKQIYRLMTASRKEMLKIINLLYSDANIYLNRKYEKINEIKNIAV